MDPFGVRGTVKVRGSIVAASACLLFAACINSADVSSADRQRPSEATIEASGAVDTLPAPVQVLDIDASDHRFDMTPDPTQPLRRGGRR